MEESVWKALREKTVGGSEIGAILGVHPYQSCYHVFLSKTGQLPPKEENKYMRAGKALEPVIVQLWQHESGFQIIEGSESNTLYYHPDHPFISGTPDRLYLNENGDRCVLECKNTRLSIDPENVPLHWWCQLQYYMMLTKTRQGEIAWLFQGVDLFRASFDFSASFSDFMVEKAVDFWKNHVEKNLPPPAYGADLSHLFPRHLTGKSVTALPETHNLLDRIKIIRDQRSALLNEETGIIDQLKMIMQDAEYLVDDNHQILASWKTSKDSKRIFLIK